MVSMPNTFMVSDYADRIDSSTSSEYEYWRWWRGYRFMVSRPVVIHKFLFSNNMSDFSVALYESNANSVPLSVLAYVRGADYAPEPDGWGLENSFKDSSGRNISKVLVVPDVRYILAAGVNFSPGGVFNDLQVKKWNVESMVSSFDLISEWFPTSTDQDEFLSLSWHFTGPHTSLVDTAPSTSTSGRCYSRPDLGFSYTDILGSSVRVGGRYEEISDGWTKVDGVWREVDGMWTRVGGVWRSI